MHLLAESQIMPLQNGTDSTDLCTTQEAASLLGMAVRSVQAMADRGELQAWKTPGGHRRISRASVQRWLDRRGQGADPEPAARPPQPALAPLRALLIEDSRHYQNLVSLIVRAQFPRLQLHVADDGISGLAMAGQLQPQLLIVDILLPGIDGATLITGLRSHAAFAASRLIVITSLDEADRAPYRFALEGVPVVHKTQVVTDLPPLLAEALGEASAVAPSPGAGRPA